MLDLGQSILDDDALSTIEFHLGQIILSLYAQDRCSSFSIVRPYLKGKSDGFVD